MPLPLPMPVPMPLPMPIVQPMPYPPPIVHYHPYQHYYTHVYDAFDDDFDEDGDDFDDDASHDDDNIDNIDLDGYYDHISYDSKVEDNEGDDSFESIDVDTLIQLLQDELFNHDDGDNYAAMGDCDKYNYNDIDVDDTDANLTQIIEKCRGKWLRRVIEPTHEDLHKFICCVHTQYHVVN